jgi:hypothetical protein
MSKQTKYLSSELHGETRVAKSLEHMDSPIHSVKQFVKNSDQRTRKEFYTTHQWAKKMEET